MGSWRCTLGQKIYNFADLKTLLAKATPARSGDELAGIAARSPEERVAAQMALADLPLSAFLSESVVPYEDDEVTRLIVDHHDAAAFAPVAAMCVGEFRDWLLSDSPIRIYFPRLRPASLPKWPPQFQRSCGSRTSSRLPPKSASSPASATRSACRAVFPPGCNPTIRPTTPSALLPALSTDSPR